MGPASATKDRRRAREVGMTGTGKSRSDIHELGRSRPSPQALPSSEIRQVPVRLDLESYRVWVSGGPLALRPKEQRLLGLLQESPNCPVGFDVLVPALYGNTPVESGRVRLRRLVADIRARFGPELARRLRTIHGVGLVLTNAGTDPLQPVV